MHAACTGVGSRMPRAGSFPAKYDGNIVANVRFVGSSRRVAGGEAALATGTLDEPASGRGTDALSCLHTFLRSSCSEGRCSAKRLAQNLVVIALTKTRIKWTSSEFDKLILVHEL